MSYEKKILTDKNMHDKGQGESSWMWPKYHYFICYVEKTWKCRKNLLILHRCHQILLLSHETRSFVEFTQVSHCLFAKTWRLKTVIFRFYLLFPFMHAKKKAGKKKTWIKHFLKGNCEAYLQFWACCTLKDCVSDQRLPWQGQDGHKQLQTHFPKDTGRHQ